ncbi:hypothetical protein HS1genome_2131 [Sulfodiicoccus acidiphilus]|uniref:Uncharacterized protein n=1 Tax=Sulfodiicoccus acidiphilus TaxID=1670455 RepID=A0A348B6E0_9CREN|nr:hypothetical protein [Sulfodiicoccus acidiphilus]BBD73742.1 hypothetical protein HS1genome_2131 [Sulfodiicoccus acidiphilus]GGT98012.1 hypothetical protein GCM10007116_14480 [Sulfodiicoccus acidiphilus]
MRDFLLRSNKFLTTVLSLVVSLVARLSYRSTALAILLFLIMMYPLMLSEYMSDLQLLAMMFQSIGLLALGAGILLIALLIAGLTWLGGKFKGSRWRRLRAP